MVHNRKFWPQGFFKIFGSYVPFFTVTSLKESALRSVDMFSRQKFFYPTRVNRLFVRDGVKK